MSFLQAEQPGAGKNREESPVRPAVGFRITIPQTELPWHAGEQRFVDRRVSRRPRQIVADFTEPDFPFAL